MSNDKWWYYEMGYENAKHPTQKSGGGGLIFIILSIAALIMLGALVAVYVWYFA